MKIKNNFMYLLQKKLLRTHLVSKALLKNNLKYNLKKIVLYFLVYYLGRFKNYTIQSFIFNFCQL